MILMWLINQQMVADEAGLQISGQLDAAGPVGTGVPAKQETAGMIIVSCAVCGRLRIVVRGAHRCAENITSISSLTM
jgi:hypothetical protein